MNTQVKTIQNYQRTIFWALSSMIVVSIFLYGMFVYSAIIHTAQRSQVAEANAELQSEISELEFTLIDSDKIFTTSYAYESGFSDVVDMKFVERTTETRLSYNQ
jgi:heme/copper-type cytochrome/quinol oxidase subunit 2